MQSNSQAHQDQVNHALSVPLSERQRLEKEFVDKMDSAA